jgi:hypothetical protein
MGIGMNTSISDEIVKFDSVSKIVFVPRGNSDSETATPAQVPVARYWDLYRIY